MFLRELERLPREKPTDSNLPVSDLGLLSNECMILAGTRFERGDRRGGRRALNRAREFADEFRVRMATVSSREEFIWGPRRVQ